MSLSTPLLERFHKLESGLRMFLDRLTIVNRRLEEAERERDALRKEVNAQQEHIRLLQQQVKDTQKKPVPAPSYFHKSDKNRKLVENYVHKADNPAELKEKLDEYIREIDQCIAYLSSSNTL
jgi:chromosome segregation ATPase